MTEPKLADRSITEPAAHAPERSRPMSAARAASVT